MSNKKQSLTATFFQAATRKDGGECQSLTLKAAAARSFTEVAKALATKYGLKISDTGRKENSSCFREIRSFGVEGSLQRLFVFAG